jgi:hypothetical protein
MSLHSEAHFFSILIDSEYSISERKAFSHPHPTDDQIEPAKPLNNAQIGGSFFSGIQKSAIFTGKSEL